MLQKITLTLSPPSYRDPLNPGSPPPLIGFVTYNSKIHFYDMKGGNNRQIRIVSDIAETFAPSTTFLVDPLTNYDQIER